MKRFLPLILFIATPISAFAADCVTYFCVGMILPLSGPVGEYGQAIQNGVSLAQEASPASFKGIRFLYEDSEYKPAKSVSSFKKLTFIDKAQLTYTFGGSVSEVVGPIGQQLKRATLISSIDPTAKIGNPYVIRFSNPASDFGSVLASELQRIAANRITIVLTENHYLRALVQGLKESLAPHQALTILESYQPTDKDFKAVITKIGKEQPEALGVFLLPGQVSQFFRELHSQKILVPTFGSDVFESQSEIQAAQGAMNGSFLAHHTVSEVFRTQYKRIFGNDFQIAYAGQGYDLANLLSSLFLDESTQLGPKEILDKMRSAPPQNGITGTFQFTSNAQGDEYFSFPVMLRKIENNTLSTVPLRSGIGK